MGLNDSELELKIRKLLEMYKDVPFVHNGRSLEGLDCLGFIIHFYGHFGISIPSDDGKEIDKDWFKTDPQRYIRNIMKLGGKQIAYWDLKPLDLVYFAISRNIITHTGIMISDREFAHMSPKKNLQISRIDGPWRARCRGAVRLI